MKNSFLPVLLLTCTLSTFSQQATLFKPKDIDIPYKKFVLENGLRLIVHEDHKAPIAAVNVWYAVGSKNEKPGKSGFAHLFEHLMFNGSEHYNFDYFKVLEAVGATELNGSTNFDRTNYYQNVPVAALDQVLWLESDRMGHLLGSIDQARLDEQRGVVQNEKRQRENEPYGKEFEMMTKACYPAGHPYSWTVIGSMEDLNAASLEDVKAWFKNYYGAANAVIVIAGDVNAAEIHERVKKYFGNIPSGPPVAAIKRNIAKRTEDTRQIYADRVSETRISMYWNVPGWGTKDAALLDLASDILTEGKNSVLYKKLMYDDPVAAYVFSYSWSKELSGTFNVTVNVRPGGNYAKVEETTSYLLKALIEKGPGHQELNRIKAARIAKYIKGLEKVGGEGGKSDVLADGEVFGGDPGFYKNYLKWINAATVEEMQQVFKKWLCTGRHTIVCTPFPSYSTSGNEADRTKLPALTAQPESSFPDIQTDTLKNGMKVVLAQRKGSPVVLMDMLFNAGYAADVYSKPGTSNLTVNLMDEGTTTLTSLQLNEKLQQLGTDLFSFSEIDYCVVAMNTLQQTLPASLNLFADVILHPSLPTTDFKRLKEEQLNTIKRDRTEPFNMVLRVFPKILYGAEHPYGIPFSGSGYEKTVATITREEVVKFHDTWIRPDNATLLVVGDVEMPWLMSTLESKFGSWAKGGRAPKSISEVSSNKNNKLYLLDRPGSEQSTVVAGYLTAPYGKIPEIERESLMALFGEDFTSRLNMNLREDKHWSYGARGIVLFAKGPRVLLTIAPVQTDKTKESILEIRKEFKNIVGDRPVTQEELDRSRNNLSMKLPGKWETNEAVRNSLVELVKYNLPEDYFKTYSSRVNGLTLEAVQQLSQQLLSEEKLSWFVVGDKEKIWNSLKEAGFSEIIEVDADGEVLHGKENK